MDFVAYLILAARRKDGDDWTQILVFVVLAAFWVVGGIMKARANKASTLRDEGKEQSPQPGPARPQRHPVRAGLIEPEPVTFTPIAVEKRRKIPESIIETNIQGLKSEIGEVTRKKASKPAVESAGPILRFEDPDELKKAILYYEILGKPISLRESQNF